MVDAFVRLRSKQLKKMCIPGTATQRGITKEAAEESMDTDHIDVACSAARRDAGSTDEIAAVLHRSMRDALIRRYRGTNRGLYASGL